MRLLANENIPLEIVIALRAQGHDVSWVRTSAPGSSDRDVLKMAVTEDRLVITFDKDFGELVLRGECSVPPPRRAAQMAASALAGRADWTGNFAVVEETRIRMTPLPRADR